MSEHSEIIVDEPRSSRPHLHDVLVRYTALMRSWREELEKIVPYRDYINNDPITARRFHEQAMELVKVLRELGG